MNADSAIVAAEAPAPGVPLGRMAVVAVACLAVIIAAGIYPLVSPLRDFGPITLERQAVGVLQGVAWLATLLVAMARQPNGRLWKLIFTMIVADRIYMFSFVPNSLVWSVARPLENVAVAVFLHLLLAYPSGNLQTRFDRAVVLFGYSFAIVWTALRHLVWDSAFACDPDCVRNLFVVWPSQDIFEALGRIQALILVAVLAPLVLMALWRHWRDASPAGRRSLLPLVVAIPIQVFVVSLEGLSNSFGLQAGIDFFASPSGEVILLLLPLILPVGLLLGILRTRWSRGRIAGLVVELGRGVPIGGLREVLARALSDPTLQLAFASPSGGGFVDADGRPTELPDSDEAHMVTRLERDGELLGILVHDPAIEAEDPGLVEAVGNAARMALENERLAAEVRAQLEEVRASRARIVEAADSERRRVERDLHDGAQQRLVALAMRLQVAKETTPGSAELLDEATTELQTAIGEVRGLARGIHPTILTEAGLRAAVDALAERTPIPVVVNISERRYDAQVEATAYFVVAEAMTNIARYASATEACVSAVEEDGRLIVTVVDDGRGGADPAAGSGLRGLADRLAALDGRLTVSSPSDGGTTLQAELPLDPKRGTTHDGRVPVAPTTHSMVRAVPELRPARPARTRLRLSNPAVLIAVVAGSIAIIAVAAALPAMQPGAPINERADAFLRPFVYQVPADSGITLDAMSDHLHVLRPAGREAGISIWAVDDVLVDHCDWDPKGPPGPVRPRQPGVEGLLSYLRSVDHLRLADVGRFTIDGRPAVRLDLTVGQGDSGCVPPSAPHILLWRDTSRGGDVAMQVPVASRVPVSILDVDEETIAIEIWSGDPVDAWEPTAERIIESIRFLYRPPSSSSPATSLVGR
jgi:signal transduction histidine kinase